jgi:hypothetical protein
LSCVSFGFSPVRALLKPCVGQSRSEVPLVGAAVGDELGFAEGDGDVRGFAVGDDDGFGFAEGDAEAPVLGAAVAVETGDGMPEPPPPPHPAANSIEVPANTQKARRDRFTPRSFGYEPISSLLFYNASRRL